MDQESSAVYLDRGTKWLLSILHSPVYVPYIVTEGPSSEKTHCLCLKFILVTNHWDTTNLWSYLSILDKFSVSVIASFPIFPEDSIILFLSHLWRYSLQMYADCSSYLKILLTCGICVCGAYPKVQFKIIFPCASAAESKDSISRSISYNFCRIYSYIWDNTMQINQSEPKDIVVEDHSNLLFWKIFRESIIIVYYAD